MKMPPRCLLLLPLSLATAVAYTANFTSVLLTDAVNATGARCLDGSPQRYWLSAPSRATPSSWSIHLMGGAWCESPDDCAARAYAPSCIRGSSSPACYDAAVNAGNSVPGVNFSDPMSPRDIPSFLGARWGGGLINDDPVANPLSAGWGHVWVQYCDGGSFLGDNDTVASGVYAGVTRPLYYRGWRNFAAVVDDLVARHGLGDATDVLLSGDSAGGLATYHHIDFLAGRLPAAVVAGVPDSGFFFVDGSYPAWGDALAWVASAMNARLPPACVAGVAAAGGDPATCIRPEVAAAWITAPTFAVGSRFDPALDSITGGPNGGGADTVRRLGAELLALLNATLLAASPRNGYFISSCHQHCGQWGQGQVTPVADFNVTIDGVGMAGAVAAWYGAVRAGTPPPRRVWVQEAGFPCAACCEGGQA